MNRVKINSINNSLIEEYKNSLKDKDFKNLVNELGISEKLGSLNNSNLWDSVNELKNCQNCPGLFGCKNKVIGHFLYPKIDGNIMDFGYTSCHFEKKNNELLKLRNTANKILLNARMKDIDISDKKRIKLIKWIKEFYDNYDGIKYMDGLYLYGSYGSGKTYLLYALLNELKKTKRIDYEAIYFPTALKDLKDDWDTYSEKLNRYSKVDILLIDDIGAEVLSEWGRDEVLGTILQYRMSNKLTTFFTSNLSLEELEEHLSLTKNSINEVKARRIMERIKDLTVSMELITESKRKK